MQGMQWRQYDKVQKEENNTFNVIQTHTQKKPKKNPTTKDWGSVCLYPKNPS